MRGLDGFLFRMRSSSFSLFRILLACFFHQTRRNVEVPIRVDARSEYTGNTHKK
jgi:hypothetical protein